MKLESIHKKLLAYLQNYNKANTYRLSRHLEIDRIELLNIIEELKNANLVEFKSNIVFVPEIAPQEILAIKEKEENILKTNNIEARRKRIKQKIQKDLALKILGDVNPAHCFYMCNGTILKNLEELLNALENIDDESYRFHANNEKNDFSSWIKDVLGDEELASNLRIKDKEEATLILKDRIDYLKTI